MNESTVHSDEEAALIEAHIHACALAQRYAHACEELLEEGELNDRLNARREELDILCDRLETLIRGRDLMPHDINVDKEDLARLADRFREWLDHERHSYLQRALADREADLVDRLDALLETGHDDRHMRTARSAAQRMLEALST